ncbi:hypothetical protein ACIRYZ_04950 [Kitasatospora sp. NPDC101155]|uniref:hypothetical protein n=1 Tax=unclassified Kitasatospora TaxID=2633591 RepID=UPI0037229242
MPRTSLIALIVTVLALAAAVVSVIAGFWIGLIWLPLAGVASNVLWLNRRKAKLAEAATAAEQD